MLWDIHIWDDVKKETRTEILEAPNTSSINDVRTVYQAATKKFGEAEWKMIAVPHL